MRSYNVRYTMIFDGTIEADSADEAKRKLEDMSPTDIWQDTAGWDVSDTRQEVMDDDDEEGA
jgi:hypothetical protein